MDAVEEFSALDLIEQEMFSNESIGSIIKKALAANTTELENMTNKKSISRFDANIATPLDKTKKSNQIAGIIHTLIRLLIHFSFSLILKIKKIDSNEDDEPADAATLYSSKYF